MKFSDFGVMRLPPEGLSQPEQESWFLKQNLEEARYMRSLGLKHADEMARAIEMVAMVSYMPPPPKEKN